MIRLLACLVVVWGLLTASAAPLAAATAADLIGAWVVDTDATWGGMATDPKMAEQMKAMSPDQQTTMKRMMASQMGLMTFAITADKAKVTKPDGSVEENGYKVTKIAGDVISIENTDPKKAGKNAFSGDVTVKDGRLHMHSKGSSMTATIVLKPAAP